MGVTIRPSVTSRRSLARNGYLIWESATWAAAIPANLYTVIPRVNVTWSPRRIWGTKKGASTNLWGYPSVSVIWSVPTTLPKFVPATEKRWETADKQCISCLLSRPTRPTFKLKMRFFVWGKELLLKMSLLLVRKKDVKNTSFVEKEVVEKGQNQS